MLWSYENRAEVKLKWYLLYGRNQGMKQGKETNKKASSTDRSSALHSCLHFHVTLSEGHQLQCKNSLWLQKVLHQVIDTRINLSRIVCSCEHLRYWCTKATVTRVMVSSTSGWCWRQESILSRWAWLTKGEKSLEGLNQNQYSLYFNLSCFQVYIKLFSAL